MIDISLRGRLYGLYCICLILAACTTSSPVPVATQPTVEQPAQTIIQGVSATAVPASTSTPARSSPTAQDIPTRIDTFLKRLGKVNHFSGAVLVAQNGTILLARGYGLADREQQLANTPHTKFRLASITKQFTAMAILILQERGKLNVEDHICSYLQSCPAAWQDITLHQLLTHTSGIPNLIDFPDYDSFKQQPATPEQTIARFRDKPLDFQPGEQWHYSNSGYILLGAIIETVSGTSYEQFLHHAIFEPLHMQDTGYDHNSSELAHGYLADTPAQFIDMSVPYAAGGLYSTVEDLYRWDQALYTDQLLSQTLRDQMFRAAATIPQSNGLGYGYGWIVGRLSDRRVVGHDGRIEGFSTYITRLLDDKVTIIVLSNQERIDVNEISIQISKMVFGEL